LNNSLEDRQTITAQEIRAWHRILIKIRDQAMRAGSGTALRELILIAIAIYYLSSGLFSFGYSLSRNAKLELLYVMMVVSVESTVKILIKVSKAVKVAQEV
jgi:ABC-type multidrug transport system permease subunit